MSSGEGSPAADPAARLAVDECPVGSGFAAAHVVSLAAALCESAARHSLDAWGEARGLAVQAVRLRTRADEAGAANAGTYARARELLRVRPGPPPSGRDAMLRAGLLAAADSLLVIGRTAADCAALAAEMARSVSPDLQADLAGAGELAAGAAGCIALLVDVNLALPADDPRRREARALVAAAQRDCAATRRQLLT